MLYWNEQNSSKKQIEEFKQGKLKQTKLFTAVNYLDLSPISILQPTLTCAPQWLGSFALTLTLTGNLEKPVDVTCLWIVEGNRKKYKLRTEKYSTGL